MTHAYVPRYDSLPRFTQFHRFFYHTLGGRRSKVTTIQKLIIGKFGPAMSVPGQNGPDGPETPLPVNLDERTF